MSRVKRVILDTRAQKSKVYPNRLRRRRRRRRPSTRLDERWRVKNNDIQISNGESIKVGRTGDPRTSAPLRITLWRRKNATLEQLLKCPRPRRSVRRRSATTRRPCVGGGCDDGVTSTDAGSQLR